MPIHIDSATFEDFDRAVAHVKRTKPGIKNPEGYVAEIERKQRGAKREELRQMIASYDDKRTKGMSINEKRNYFSGGYLQDTPKGKMLTPTNAETSDKINKIIEEAKKRKKSV